MRRVLFATLLLIAAPAAGGSKKKAPPKPVALMPVLQQGQLTPTLVAELNAALRRKLVQLYPNAIVGDAVAKRLSEAPTAALARCAGEPACVSKLGRALKVDEVVYGYANAAAGGARVELNVVSAADGKIERKVAFRLTRPSEVAALVDRHSTALFGTSAPAPASKPPALSDAFEDLPLAPLTPSQPAVATTEIQALPSPAVSQTSTPSATPYITYTGVGLGALGLAIVSAGAYFGITSRSIYSDANARNERGFFTLTGQEAQRLQRQADDVTALANALYATGLITAALGGALVALDLVVLEDTRAEISVDGQGARAHILWMW